MALAAFDGGEAMALTPMLRKPLRSKPIKGKDKDRPRIVISRPISEENQGVSYGELGFRTFASAPVLSWCFLRLIWLE